MNQQQLRDWVNRFGRRPNPAKPTKISENSEWSKHPSVQIPEDVQKQKAWNRFQHRREIKQEARLKKRHGLWDFSSDEDEARQELERMYIRLERNVKVQSAKIQRNASLSKSRSRSRNRRVKNQSVRIKKQEDDY